MSGFAVFDSGYRCEVLPFVKRSEFFVTVSERGKDRRRGSGDLVAVLADKTEADRLAEQITSARAEKSRREAAARRWFEDLKQQLVAKATGGEA